MLKPLYKKGNMLVWIGFLIGILFRVLPLFSTPETFPGLASLTPIFNILSLIFLAILIWGLVLVLKAKGRSWAWVLLLVPLNIIGIIIIFMLKDELPQQEVPIAPTYPQT